MFDAIIVGAGPGGASAAYFLGQAGKRVLVVEKQKLPRYKACGGGVSLRMLGKYFPFSFEPVVQAHVKTICYVMGNDHVMVPLPENWLGMVMRSDFDAFILKHSRAEIIDETPVVNIIENDDGVIIETKDGRHFEAKYLIGADGVNSQVARFLHLHRKKKPIPALEAEVKVAPEVMARFSSTPVFIFSAVRHGYLWIFPKTDYLSVGVADFRHNPGSLYAALAQVMSGYGISLDKAEFHGHSIPLYSGLGRIATHRCLLIGDAAGLVDPLSGEGIRLAIKSASLAVQSILAGDLRTYSRKVFWRIGLSQSLALLLKWCFYYFTELCFILGVYNPLASQAFMRLLADEIGYGGIFFRIFGSLPVFFVTEISSGLVELAGNLRLAEKIRRWVYGQWMRVEG